MNKIKYFKKGLISKSMDNKIKDIIKILEEIKDSEILIPIVNEEIIRTLKKVQSIYDENTVKVAVLGEFSAGKSTFINGILGDNILSYGDEPTTAINTYIKYGNTEEFLIWENDIKYKNISKNQISQYIKETKIKKKFKKLEIYNNNSFLKSGLIIIDTPGANINKIDHNIQRKIAIDESSVGVFLISGQSLTSKSFLDFLNNNKKDLQKIVFVITKCDIFDSDEIDIDISNKTPKDKLKDAKKYIEDTIKEYGNIKNPIVHTVSAKFFIENKKSNLFNVEKTFRDVEKSIREMAIKDKSRVIENEVNRILRAILIQLENELKSTEISTEEEIKKVNGNINEFDIFIDKIIKNFNMDLDLSIIKKRNIIKRE